ncbi:MAG: protein translocase SEC61 complex subunit gamma [Candidatus Altiarchaeota archaeon]|nr:protein translocase SEC61 complex subunit gamma [Candidatus Altiarchaeota archaeon]
MRIPDIRGKANYAYKETRRILRLTRKPRGSEFNETAKITGLGIIVIGLLGFAIFVIAQLVGFGQ